MSLLSTADPWLNFFQRVALLQSLCLQSPNRSVLLSEGRRLLEGLNQAFQLEILPQLGTGAVPDTLQRYLTETHRQLRLLSTDLSLYQAARTEMLQQQRLKGMCDRLEQLSSYGPAIEQVLQNSSETKVLPESPQR
jgi:hypothetical protein